MSAGRLSKLLSQWLLLNVVVALCMRRAQHGCRFKMDFVPCIRNEKIVLMSIGFVSSI